MRAADCALKEQGFYVFPFDPEVARWSAAAAEVGCDVLAAGGDRRHGATWFVGVDALPNADDGSVAGVPLAGEWRAHVAAPDVWHKAQLSVVFPGYPAQDVDESDAAHRFRRNRDAAHVDGLLPEGADRRRHLREPHGFILGLPLNDVAASPLVVWPGSHQSIHAAFQARFAGLPPERWGDEDVTEAYQAARKQVFEACTRTEVAAKPGQAILLNRHLVHGVAPWAEGLAGDMRMIAYFRPLVAPQDWMKL